MDEAPAPISAEAAEAIRQRTGPPGIARRAILFFADNCWSSKASFNFFREAPTTSADQVGGPQ
jgi:hypothetical protein